MTAQERLTDEARKKLRIVAATMEAYNATKQSLCVDKQALEDSEAYFNWLMYEVHFIMTGERIGDEV